MVQLCNIEILIYLKIWDSIYSPNFNIPKNLHLRNKFKNVPYVYYLQCYPTSLNSGKLWKYEHLILMDFANRFLLFFVGKKFNELIRIKH
jgi:hypothetical protein